MSFTGRFVPEELGGRGIGPFASLMARLVLAGLATAAVIGLAFVGMLCVRAPTWVSLIFEPLSLFFLPGLIVGIFKSDPHDIVPRVVVHASVIFYFVLFLGALEWRASKRRRRARAARG